MPPWLVIPRSLSTLYRAHTVNSNHWTIIADTYRSALQWTHGQKMIIAGIYRSVLQWTQGQKMIIAGIYRSVLQWTQGQKMIIAGTYRSALQWTQRQTKKHIIIYLALLSIFQWMKSWSVCVLTWFGGLNCVLTWFGSLKFCQLWTKANHECR